MPTRKKKSRKQRGSRYCGWGQVGQHRKSGGRGGFGKAGGRDHFWIRTLKNNPDRYKNIGFKPPSSLRPDGDTINIGEIEHILLTHEKQDEAILDLTSLGITKLLGRGSIGTPLRIRVKEYSTKAYEKIEEAGGSIIE
jgi:large subunit ribosomal protein L15